MHFSHLRLAQFRCYPEGVIEPDRRFNVICGRNGQGKTSLLEAIGLLSHLKSFRGAKSAEMIAFSFDEGRVEGKLQHDDLKLDLAVRLYAGRRQATLNGKTCKFLSEYIRKVAAVSFSPTDLEIVRGSPELRRGWIDRFVQIFEPLHADVSTRFQKTLDQRNSLLRSLSEGKISTLPDDFSTWSESLVNLGAEVVHNRLQQIQKAAEKVGEFYRQISGENALITIQYKSSFMGELRCGQEALNSLEQIGQTLKQSLEEKRLKECIFVFVSINL